MAEKNVNKPTDKQIRFMLYKYRLTLHSKVVVNFKITPNALDQTFRMDIGLTYT